MSKGRCEVCGREMEFGTICPECAPVRYCRYDPHIDGKLVIGVERWEDE